MLSSVCTLCYSVQSRFLLGKVSFFFVTIQFIYLGVIGHFTPLHNIDVEASISTFCHRHKNSLSVSGVEDILLLTSTLHTDEVQFFCCCLLLLLLLEPLSIKEHGLCLLPSHSRLASFPSSSVFPLLSGLSLFIVKLSWFHSVLFSVKVLVGGENFLWFFLNVISWQTDCSSPRTQYKEVFAQPSFKIHVSSSLEIERTFTPWGRQVLMILIADLVFVLVRVVNVKFVHQIASLCSVLYPRLPF